MNTCRKTHRKCTVAELIGKFGVKLEGKGNQATGEENHVWKIKYSLNGRWISM